jgi:hypothetical protein
MTTPATSVRDTSVPVAAKLAAVQFVALGAGFGAATLVVLGYLARDGVLPMTPWGFRALDGPLARIGTTQTFVFGGALAATELTGLAAGLGLWRGRRWAGRLGLAITPVSLALGVGFELPFLLVGIPLRVATLLSARSRLR